MPLVTNDEVTRIPLTSPGEWAEVKTRLSKGDRTRLQAAGTNRLRAQIGSERGAELAGDITLDEELLDAVTFRGLEIGILRLCIASHQGEEPQIFGPVPADVFRALSEEDYAVITERVNELWQPRTPEASANLSVSSPAPSLAGVNGRES